MHVFEVQRKFGLDHLHATERPRPAPGHGQILVRLTAASLNFRDYLMVTGVYNPKIPLPIIPCSDGVGIVEELGPDVDRVAVGDRVAALFAPHWHSGHPTRERVRNTLGGPLDGTLAEYMVLDQDSVVHVPAHLSHVEAASLPCAALTAWSALATLGDVKAGETVLVQGTGGVSLFALQFALCLGARVIVTSSSDHKLRRAREMGCWRTINYVDDPEWGKTAKKMTDGLGVDHVVDVGGAGTLPQSCWAVRIGGQISLIGVLAGSEVKMSVTPILMQNIRVQGVFVGHRESFEAMNRAIEVHELHPVIDRVFPFDEAREAFLYMAAGRHMGKICIEF